jgi:electron transfer flavoprotein alpha subunit
MSEILVFCENNETACELVSEANKFKDGLKAKLATLVLNKENERGIDRFFRCGTDKVYTVVSNILSQVQADTYADAIIQVMNRYQISILILGSTKLGKQIAPIIAQKISAGCITDVIGLKLTNGELAADRYAYGGNTIATLLIKTPRQVISVMPKTFPIIEESVMRGEIITDTLQIELSKLTVLEKQPKTGESAPIEEANMLICIGRGLADKKDIIVIENLAAALKGEIGATRPLTHDWHWFHESREVGLSGKKCKPRLCLSVGISGQIQHTVGIRGAKIIMAINKDKNAPIFKMADYGIIADLYEVVPRLTQLVQSHH